MIFKIDCKEYFNNPLGSATLQQGQAIGLIAPDLLAHMFPHFTKITFDNVSGVIDNITGVKYKLFYSKNGVFNTDASYTKGVGRCDLKTKGEHWNFWDKFILLTNNGTEFEIQIVEKE